MIVKLFATNLILVFFKCFPTHFTPPMVWSSSKLFLPYPIHVLRVTSIFSFSHCFRPFQTERICRQQLLIWWKWQKVLKKDRKHCGKRRNCSLRAISPFPTLSVVQVLWKHLKTRVCLGGVKEKMLLTTFSHNIFCPIRDIKIIYASINTFLHNDTFWLVWERSLFKILWEKEKMLVTIFSPFPTMFLLYQRQKLSVIFFPTIFSALSETSRSFLPLFTHSHTMTPFDLSGKEAFSKYCGKRRKCW